MHSWATEEDQHEMTIASHSLTAFQKRPPTAMLFQCRASLRTNASDLGVMWR